MASSEISAGALEPEPLAALQAALDRGLGRVGPRLPNFVALFEPPVSTPKRVHLTSAAKSATRKLLEDPSPPLADASLVFLFEPEPDAAAALATRARHARVLLRDPQLGGRGVAALRAAGVAVDESKVPALSDRVAPHLNAERWGRPDVLIKVASSLDGRVATRSGHSQWITGSEARARGRRMRAEVDAILVGSGTALADDPALTSRLEGFPTPIRVVLDSRLRLPPTSQLAQTAREVPTWVFTAPGAAPEARRALEAEGVRVEVVPADTEGRVSPAGALARLYGLGVRTVLVEGGPTVVSGFVDAGLADRVAWFMAPLLIGGAEAKAGLAGQGVGRLEEALALEAPRYERLGPDLLVTGALRRRG